MVGNLTLALKSASSGLLTNQAALEATAQNVANVNTEGYSRKNVNLESRIVAGTGAGVQLASFTRDIDEGLLRDLRTEYNDLNEVEVQERYYERMEELFGTPAANTSLSHNVTELAEAWESLALTPDQLTEQSEVVRWAERLTDQLNRMTNTIQDLRLQADQQIDDTVDRLNTLTTDIADLNDQIIRNSAVSNDVTDLEDKRDIALTELAQLIDIQYYEDNSGAIVIYTENGNTLVGDDAQAITHVAVTQIGEVNTHEEGQINGIFIGEGATYEDITNTIRGGELKGLVDLRDGDLVDAQAEIDTFAGELRDTLNRIHNRGVPFPGLETMTGSRSFEASLADMGDRRFTTLPLQFTSTSVLDADDTITGPAGTFLDGNGNPLPAGTQITFSSTDPANGDEGTTFTIGSVDATGTTATLDANDTISDEDTFEGVMTISNAPSVTIASGESVDIVVFDSDGNQVDTVNLGAGTYSIADGSTNSLVGFLNDFLTNGQLENQSYGTASMDSNNKLSVNMNSGFTLAFKDNGTDSTGDVAMNIDWSQDGETDETIMGFSNFFGLNDFFSDPIDQDYLHSEQKALGWTWTAPTAGANLTFTSDGGSSESISLTAGTTYSLNDLATAINNDTTGISFVTATVISDGDGQVLRLVQDNSESMVVFDGVGDTLFADLGIQVANVRSAGQLSVRSDIASSPQSISTSKVALDSNSGEFNLSRGDNSIPSEIAEMFTQKQDFSAAGGIGNVRATFGEFGSTIITSVSSQASINRADQEYLSGLVLSLETKSQAISGVNLDEEMANLILYEQAYSAAARVIATINEMFDTLQDAVR